VLFTTATFAFVFLPLVLAGYYLLGRRSPTWAAAWLLAASVFFYGYWMPVFTLLLLASIAGNFAFGKRIAQTKVGGRAANIWLTAGIVFDLGLLAYFKYANFFVANLDALLGTHWGPLKVILPIGISFYTFASLSYTLDVYRGEVRHDWKLADYALFVSFFPHLVAGPALDLLGSLPQIAAPRRPSANEVGWGLALVCLGLFCKV